MKKLTFSTMYRFLLLFLFTGIQTLVWAQDNTQSTPQTTSSSTTTTTTTTSEHFYTQPWVWIVGGIVLIIIVAALVRGKDSNSTTIIKD